MSWLPLHKNCVNWSCNQIRHKLEYSQWYTAPTKFEVATSNGLGDAIIRKYSFGVKVTQDVNQYPLHHVTYAHAKFEVPTSNGLGGDAFT